MARKLRLLVTLALALSVVAGFSGGAVAMTPADADVGTDGFDDGFDSIDAADGATDTLSLSGPCPPHLLIPQDPECY